MVDYFALALSHGLLILAIWRLAASSDLDKETGEPAAEPEPTKRR